MHTRKNTGRENRFGAPPDFISLISLSLFTCTACFAQYYPATRPIRGTKLPTLPVLLKNSRPYSNKVKSLPHMAGVNKPNEK